MAYKRISPQPVVEGGTGAQTLTIHGVLLGQTTSAISALANGTTGQLLTAVTGLDPIWSAPAASSISITGDTGGALTGASFTFAGGTTGLAFGGSGSTETLTFAGITANGGTVSLATDATTSTINVGTGAGIKTSTFGSTNSTSATTVQSGSGALNVTATGGALTINSGIGALGISTDASATTLSIGTGGAVKTVTLGSTNSTSVTTVASGTGGANFGTSANAHVTTVGSTTAAATTIIQAPTGGVTLTGVQGVAVANKNYVTINTATGAIGSDAGAASSISITGDTGGALTGAAFTFSGGTTGLAFGGSGSTETLTFAGITANGGTVSLATDATTSTINVGTGAGVKTSTFGSTNSTSATTIQSGSGALNITSTNGAQTHNSGTGVMGISTDASATTVNIATGGAVKTVTLGSTNTTSTTTIQSGSGNIIHNTGLTVDSTGRMYNTKQPAVRFYNASNITNATGDGTNVTVTFDTQSFQQGSNFASNTFTAPIAGIYNFISQVSIFTLGALHTQGDFSFICSNAAYNTNVRFNPATMRELQSGNNILGITITQLASLTAGQTVSVNISVTGSTKTVGILGGATNTFFTAYLVC